MYSYLVDECKRRNIGFEITNGNKSQYSNRQTRYRWKKNNFIEHPVTFYT